MIPRVATVARLHAVPVPHTNEAVYAVDASGRRWVAKREADMGSESLLAEAVSWLLASAIGAPVPDAAFCDDPGERAWLSAQVPEVSHWVPPLAARLADPAEAGAILALDLLVFNEARHARNLLAEGVAGGLVRLWAIDADEALVGYLGDYRERIADVPSVRNHARGLPIPAVADGAHAAAIRAASWNPNLVRASVVAACDLAREPRASELADLVVRRAGALPRLMEHYLEALRGLR